MYEGNSQHNCGAHEKNLPNGRALFAICRLVRLCGDISFVSYVLLKGYNLL